MTIEPRKLGGPPLLYSSGAKAADDERIGRSRAAAKTAASAAALAAAAAPVPSVNPRAARPSERFLTLPLLICLRPL